jgi:hypothetical protein
VKYVTPSYEKLENPESKGQFFVRLAYGVVGSYMDTKQMTTREVIEEFLRKNGVKTPREFFEKKFNKNQDNKLQTENKSDSKEQVDKLFQSDRVQWGNIVTKENIQRAIDGGSEESKELTLRLFNDDSFGIGTPIVRGKTAFYPGYNKVGLANDTFGSGEKYAYSQGGIFYHECWHAIDENYGEQAKGRSLSTDYVSSFGITLRDSLVQEFDQNIRPKFKEIKQEIDKEVDEYYLSKGLDRADIKQRYNEAEKEAQKIFDDEYRLTKDYLKANDKRKQFKDSEEYKKLKKDYFDVYDDYPGAVLVKWGDLSDIISGGTKDRLNFGMHHKSSYWKATLNQSYQDVRVSEAFAEFASAKSTNPKSYDVLKRFLPNTSKIFDEIYEKLKKGEIKPNGNRHKWQP